MRRAVPSTVVLLLLSVSGTAVGLLVGARHAVGEVQGAVIEVTPASVSPGEDVKVFLSGWPQGVVTASACGNNAQRGSTDCDQIGGGSTRVGTSGTETLVTTVLAPPVGCPCVIRATTATGDVVRTAPIDIVGVEQGVNLPPVSQLPDPSALHVRAEIRDANIPLPESWYPPFAGPTKRVLVLTMTNSSSADIAGLRVAGAVGHHKAAEGEPIAASIDSIPPGATRRVRVPFDVGAPVWGRYDVTGSIYGLAAPVNFSVAFSNEPWGLELIVPFALIVIAQFLRRRERAQRRAAEAAVLSSYGNDAPLFAESSPRIGDHDLITFTSDSYDHARLGSSAVEDELMDVGQHL
jgi:sortase A